MYYMYAIEFEIDDQSKQPQQNTTTPSSSSTTTATATTQTGFVPPLLLLLLLLQEEVSEIHKFYFSATVTVISHDAHAVSISNASVKEASAANGANPFGGGKT